jgi:purine-nucleoside phosphorylase
MKAIRVQSSNSFEKVTRAVEYIWKRTAFRPEIAIILGTGLGNLTNRIQKEASIDYEEIPNFPKSTVVSHMGRLVFGTLNEKPVVVMDGRFHCYEGYSLAQVTFPVRVLRELGAKTLIISNAAGAINLEYKKGDLVLISDHINLMGVNPLIGPNDERCGVRFPDMSAPYSETLIKLAERAAGERNIPISRGVYVGVTGPCLETRAEYRMLKTLGADLVGMSTVPEVIVGVHSGFDILGISVATDVCDPDHLEPADIEEIIKVANQAGPKLDLLVQSLVQKLPDVH